MYSKEELILLLKEYGKIIGSQIDNELAKDVIKYYTMWSKCPCDNGSYVFCESAFRKWKNQYDLVLLGDYTI